ncbi:transporter substrate-binding domain-containing protein [Dasania sp. GY-MA-18]|uniref:Transporter substrate-binding domain-containing protein n=1 Tax=Dasania phycosphaerae TaxID=2950436 RepID=A0A9J6RNN7_9GAMM|nr:MULTISPECIES: transporter substrate-binding domain-containing protein [Dasania]MCR8923908.1 transporter substrate-binding domain-containing protein [Dasania sp. GY-MA-18]MCZ0866342.1 transporter substrate-binding domain-containing protein [Dasania phycosphaerae]MCZ0870066.1 transporter substrate-binding domain-containing protein [Dasania phycosphaerae]
MHPIQHLTACLSFCLLLSTAASAELKILNFATDDWPPYLIADDNGQINQGILVELINEIFARIPGVDAKIHAMPWSRAIVEVRAGRMDALPGIIYSQARSEFLRYSAPLFKQSSKLVYHKQQFPQGFHWQTKEDFIGLKIAAVRDYAMYDKLVNLLGDSSKDVIFPVLSDDILIKMVGGKRIKLGAIDELTALYLADKYTLREKLTFAEPTIDELNYHIAISKKSSQSELIGPINKIIADLQREGVIAKIIARYNTYSSQYKQLPSQPTAPSYPSHIVD